MCVCVSLSGFNVFSSLFVYFVVRHQAGDDAEQLRAEKSRDQIGWFPVAQVVRSENDPDTDRAEREAASHAAHLLRSESASGRADEGAARRDDLTESARHPRLVPEQAVQGQEEVDTDETDPDAAAATPTAAAGKGEAPRTVCCVRFKHVHIWTYRILKFVSI